MGRTRSNWLVGSLFTYIPIGPGPSLQFAVTHPVIQSIHFFWTMEMGWKEPTVTQHRSSEGHPGISVQHQVRTLDMARGGLQSCSSCFSEFLRDKIFETTLFLYIRMDCLLVGFSLPPLWAAKEDTMWCRPNEFEVDQATGRL